MYSYTICWYFTVAILVRPSTGLGLRKRRKPITFSFSFSVHFFSSCRVLKRICVDIYSNDRQITWCEPKLKYHQHINFNLLRQSLHILLVTRIAKRNGANFVPCGIPPRSYSLHSTCQIKRSDPANDLIQLRVRLGAANLELECCGPPSRIPCWNQQRIHESRYCLGQGTEGGRGENKQERAWVVDFSAGTNR